MAKIIAWLIVIFIVLLALRLVNFRNARRRAREQATKAGAPAAKGGESMVRCVRCGVYVPSADAKPGPDGLTCGEPVCLKQR